MSAREFQNSLALCRRGVSLVNRYQFKVADHKTHQEVSKRPKPKTPDEFVDYTRKFNQLTNINAFSPGNINS